MHTAKKRLGQNFLIDDLVIQRIIECIDPKPDDNIIEIGPGLGALTIPLLQKVRQLNVIEYDTDIIPELIRKVKNPDGLHVHEMDVLKFDFTKVYQKNRSAKLRITGNLPYNISTPILFHLLKHNTVISDMHLMLQKEVVERISATPGNKIYGRLSVMIQLHYSVTPLFKVPSNAFKPAPKVESAVIRLIPAHNLSARVPDFKNFELLVRTAFSQRRKTIRNNLKEICNTNIIESAGINPGCRPEEIPVESFIQLYNLIYSHL